VRVNSTYPQAQRDISIDWIAAYKKKYLCRDRPLSLIMDDILRGFVSDNAASIENSIQRAQ